MMTAANLAQTFLDLFDGPAYLEVGVREGTTLKAVRARRKVAVDPVFRFNLAEEQTRYPDTEYHPVTSDAFFASYTGAAFDVVFLDGLHTSQQTLRDLINALAFIHSRSIIIIDDVRPDNYASSLPSRADAIFLKQRLGDPSPAWMGDVYRLVFFIDSFLPLYSYATALDESPRLIIWREPRNSVAERTLAEIGQLDFLNFALNADILNPRPLPDIVSAYQSAVQRSRSM